MSPSPEKRTTSTRADGMPILSEISRKSEDPDEASVQTIFEDTAEITQLVAGDTVEMDLQT
jgi:hypothetical protein